MKMSLYMSVLKHTHRYTNGNVLIRENVQELSRMKMFPVVLSWCQSFEDRCAEQTWAMTSQGTV